MDNLWIQVVADFLLTKFSSNQQKPFLAYSSSQSYCRSPLYEISIFSIVLHLSPLYEILDVGERLVVELFGRRVQVDHLDPPPRVGRVPLHRRAVARLARPRRAQHQLRVPHLRAQNSNLHHLFHMEGNVCKQCCERRVARKFEKGVRYRMCRTSAHPDMNVMDSK